jgi:hypothetical protein
MKKYLFLALIAALFITACGSDNGFNPTDAPNDSTLVGPYFNIKAATITYSTENYVGSDNNSDIKLVLDDYGKKFRYETSEDVTIIDEDANKYYVLTPSTKTYVELSANMGTAVRFIFIYLGDDVISAWTIYPGFNKESNKTIAGKKCSVCSWKWDNESVEWGGWNRITFIYKVTADGEISKFEAKSITESANANDFKVPSDYTKIG